MAKGHGNAIAWQWPPRHRHHADEVCVRVCGRMLLFTWNKRGIRCVAAEELGDLLIFIEIARAIDARWRGVCHAHQSGWMDGWMDAMLCTRYEPQSGKCENAVFFLSMHLYK